VDPDIVVSYDKRALLLLLASLRSLNLPTAHTSLGRTPALARGIRRQAGRKEEGEGEGWGGDAGMMGAGVGGEDWVVKEMRGRVVMYVEEMLKRNERVREELGVVVSLEGASEVLFGEREVVVREEDEVRLCAGCVEERRGVGLLSTQRAMLGMRIVRRLDVVAEVFEMARVAGKH
jgi:hypothetical protein